MALRLVLYVKEDLLGEAEFVGQLKHSEYAVQYMEEVTADESLLRQQIAEAIEGRAAASECLMLVTTEAQYRAADLLGMATLPYTGAPSPQAPSFDGAWMVAEGLSEIDDDFLNKVYQRYHHLPWTIRHTERCCLRELSMEDMDALFELYAQEGITDYLEPLYDRDKEEAYERSYIDCMYRYYGYGMWLVCDRNTGEIIGRAGLEHREYGEQTELEMGYLITPKRQRMGYATEVCRAIIDYAREYTDFSRINCLIVPENIPSIRFAEKLGFQKWGRTDIAGQVMERYVLQLL